MTDIRSDFEGLPEGLGDILLSPSQWFFDKEVMSSLLLLISSLSAVYWANSFLEETYHHLLHGPIIFSFLGHSVKTTFMHVINDGIMTLFFFTVGLEIKREILVGELSTPKAALFPVIAAAGGMLFPGLIYTVFNYGTPGMSGWGIPVATDIAFALGAFAIFGKKLPLGLRVFLAAFAIADDLGAVLIIAIFYTQEIVWFFLNMSIVLVVVLIILNSLWVTWIPIYLILGVLTWFAVLGSGVHPTVAGVVVALLIPARAKYNTELFMDKVNRILTSFQYNERLDGFWFSILLSSKNLSAVRSLEDACKKVETPLQRLEHALHPWTAFLILPVFAFSNAGLSLHGLTPHMAVSSSVSLGIFLGLLVGKPVGIMLFSYISVKMGVAAVPDGVHWRHLMGASMLGGIGFTMSLFVAGLSFDGPEMLNYAKLGILAGSVASGILGVTFLYVDYTRHKKK